MLVEVSPSPMAMDPVAGRKSSLETANWSAGSPEAISVLERREGRREGKEEERRGRGEGKRRKVGGEPSQQSHHVPVPYGHH